MSLVNHLVVFVRAPKAGAVKTRLAQDIGTLNASVFYRNTTRRILHRLNVDSRWRKWLAFTPDNAVQHIRSFIGNCRETWHGIPQGTGDLGRRMERTMTVLPPGPVVIIGTDIPKIQTHHIAKAFQALGSYDAVFGPADDGGYWLVGLKRRPCVPKIFEDVRWSSEFALADTLENFQPGQRIALLEQLEDVDDGDAYLRWRAQVTNPKVNH